MMPSSNRPTSDQAPSTCAQRVDHAADDALALAAGDQVDDHLGVAGRLEQRARLDQPAAQQHGVGEVAVVADGEAAEGEVGEQRLDVAQHAGAGGRVAGMADRGVAGQALDHRAAAERVADQADRAVAVEVRAVEADDAGRLLAAMLQRVQAQRRVRRRRGHGRRSRRCRTPPWACRRRTASSASGHRSSRSTSRLRRHQLVQRLPLRRRCSPGPADAGSLRRALPETVLAGRLSGRRRSSMSAPFRTGSIRQASRTQSGCSSGLIR